MVQLTLCRLRELYREPVAVFWVHVFPLLAMSALGLAFSDPSAAALTVDLTPGPAEGWLRSALSGDARLQVKLVPEAEALARLKATETSLAVSGAGGQPLRIWHVPGRPDSELALAYAQPLLRPREPRAGLLIQAVRAGVGERYIDFLVPGLLGVGLMGGGLVGVGFVLADQRRRGLWKRLRATPAPPAVLLFSLVLARLLFLLPEAGLLLLLSRLCFGVTCEGSLPLLLGVLLLGALQFCALGLVLGAVTRTTEAVSGLISLLMLTQWVFSGVFFAATAFPIWVQPCLRWLPLTPTVAALRKTMAGAEAVGPLLPDLLPMAFWTAGAFVVGWAAAQEPS